LLVVLSALCRWNAESLMENRVVQITVSRCASLIQCGRKLLLHISLPEWLLIPVKVMWQLGIIMAQFLSHA
jgi:hypothetical protein